MKLKLLNSKIRYELFAAFQIDPENTGVLAESLP